MPAPAELLLSVRGALKRFGEVVALDGVDLDVARGDVVVIIGPSGSGKSTLLRAVNRLAPLDAGTIELAGEPLPEEGPALDRWRARVGMVFQQFNLFGHLRALDNITLAPIVAHGQPRAEAERRGRELLARVGLADKADSFPTQLSGGQQQRVAIARALACDPELLLFDEPTSALDSEMIGEVLAVMQELAAGGMTMLVVSHELAFVREAADRVVFFDEGRLIEQGPPSQVLDAPREPRTREFMAKVL